MQGCSAGDVTLGNPAGGSSLQVFGATVFESASGSITANAALDANDGLTVSGATVLGQTSSDLLTVNAATTFNEAQVMLYGSSTTAASAATLEFQRRVGTAAVTTGAVLGEMQFTGWDSAVFGLGAQIRSVFTVCLCSYSLLYVLNSLLRLLLSHGDLMFLDCLDLCGHDDARSRYHANAVACNGLGDW